MLDFNDFVTDRGGDPNKIKESQRRRYASEEIVDEVQKLFEDARKCMSPVVKHSVWWLIFYIARYEAMQLGSQLNALLKEIGKKKKVGPTDLGN